MGGSLALPKLLMDTAILSPGRMEEVRPTTLTAWGRRSLLGWTQTSRPRRSAAPMTVRLRRSSTAVTTAVCRSGSLGSGRITADTLSPFQAPPSQRGGTNRSDSRPSAPSGVKKPKPLEEAW